MQSRVDPFEHLRCDWKAFWALSTDRQIGMTAGAIPWSSIDRYAQRFDVIGDEFERLMRVIRAMDGAYLGYKKE